MTLVVDASLVLAAVLNLGSEGEWAADLMTSDALAAPHHLPLEVAHVLRQRALAGEISHDVAAIAHAEMLALSVTFYPYEPFATRIWQLRNTVTAFDAWYVALAEFLGVALATLDLRLARAPGPRCRFLTPPA